MRSKRVASNACEKPPRAGAVHTAGGGGRGSEKKRAVPRVERSARGQNPGSEIRKNHRPARIRQRPGRQTRRSNERMRREAGRARSRGWGLRLRRTGRGAATALATAVTGSVRHAFDASRPDAGRDNSCPCQRQAANNNQHRFHHGTLTDRLAGGQP
jgi:hypothetical protein